MATSTTTTTAAETTPLDMKRIIPLVTGGGSGIGLGIVKQFIERGSPKVIITGRRESVLQEAVSRHSSIIHYKVSDAGKAQDRQELFEWIQSNHPDCNCLVNNAGIQRRVAPAEDTNATWEERAQEIEINFSGVVHLCSLFLPYFLSKVSPSSEDDYVIANVSSGLAFAPFANGPVYGATKAAIHSYTMAIRYSVEDIPKIRIVEIVPPAVKSNLGGSHDFGEDCDEYCLATMERFAKGEIEIGYKFSDAMRLADRSTLDQTMRNIAATMHVQKFTTS